MTIAIRTLTREEFPAAERMAEFAFGSPCYDDDDQLGSYYASLEPDRSFAAFDAFDGAARGVIVGTAGAYSRTMGVPGALAAVAAVTNVAVRQDHRRRGVVSALMAAQLDQVADREGLAILFASEATIYERFGYAAAAPRVDLNIELARSAFGPRGRSALAAFDGTITEDISRRHVSDMASVIAAVAGRTPGVMVRPAVHGERLTEDPPARRDGATPARAVIARDPAGNAVGFARYAVKPDWNGHVSMARIMIFELMSTSTPAEAALWRYVLDTDLAVVATATKRPMPDPLARLLADERRMAPTLGEGLWCRVVDVPRALAGRRYSATVDLVLDVHDAFRPAGSGRWRVVTETDGSATVTATSDAPDLALPMTALGAAHLGSVRLTDLAVGGEIAELTPGALVAATRAWSWHRSAWAPEPF